LEKGEPGFGRRDCGKCDACGVDHPGGDHLAASGDDFRGFRHGLDLAGFRPCPKKRLSEMGGQLPDERHWGFKAQRDARALWLLGEVE
jgi:hypothetical protein